MALGFRDCCNQFNYFLLSDIPASVSEFEVYYIETLEGPSFCATYLNLPPLNYNPTTYNVDNLSQQTDCETCIGINPCPTEENILDNQFGPGSVIIQPDCNFTSIRYLQVECFPENPTFQNSLDGQVILNVVGGVPPYTFRNFNTGQVLQANPIIDNFYRVIPNVPAGDYRVVVTDTDENFLIDITCTLTAPPPFPVFGSEVTDASVFGKPDGVINLIVLSAGTPPYAFVINGIVYDSPTITIGAGTYTIIIYDEYYTTEIEVTVGQPPPVDYPSQLCFNTTVTIGGCIQLFGILFERFVNDYDYRAQYYAVNPQTISFDELNIRYEESLGGWVILPQVWGGSIQFNQPGCPAVVGLNEIGFRKVDGSTDTPDGNWDDFTSLYFSNTIVSAGVCAPSLTLISTTNVCKTSPATNGSVSLEANGGTGPPYKYFIILSSNPSSPLVSSSPIINNLNEGTYTAYVQDGQGNQSSEISFTITSIAPYIFNLANLPQCVTQSNSSVFLNVIPLGPTAANQINPGESRRSTITTSTNFNFNFLPVDFEVTTRIVVSMQYVVTVSVTPYTDPRTYFVSNFTGSPMTVSTITTNGVTTNFMSGVNPVVGTTTFPLLGDGWYRIQNGTTTCTTGTGNCPLPLDVNGARYQKTLTWTSNLLTINSTTSISFTYFNEFTNSIPIIIGTTNGGLCRNGCGGGNVTTVLNVAMNTPTKTRGCGSIAGSNRTLTRYIYNQHPNNGATYGTSASPSPACP